MYLYLYIPEGLGDQMFLKHNRIKLLNLSMLLSAILFLLVSCSGIKILSDKDIYSEEFLQSIEVIHKKFRTGKKVAAKADLLKMNDEELDSDEMAKKYNLLGVIAFSELDYSKAIENFTIATEKVNKDKPLQAQLYLNLANTFYKKEQFDNAYVNLQSVDEKVLGDDEKKNYYKLRFVVAKKLDKHKDVVDSVVYLLKDVKFLDQIEKSQYRESLLDNYRKLTSSERASILSKYESERYPVVGFLGKSEVFQRYYMGDKSGAEDVLDWLGSNFSSIPEIRKFVDEFTHRMKAFAKLDVGAIGVVLPFSAKSDVKKHYAKKALIGIETALNSNKQRKLNSQLFIKDNAGNHLVAKERIYELVQKHHVSIIIGGLFRQSARYEYLEAKKYGVFYISLSEVDVPKTQKNHLLLEITGSTQSQIHTLLKEKYNKLLGSKLGLFYPNNEHGNVIADEMSQNFNGPNMKIEASQEYDAKSKQVDIEPVKELVGVKFKRERREEYKEWSEIYSLKKSNIRRVNVLGPVIDFDWVFVPSNPNKAIHILNAFRYMDVKGLTFVGGPDWAKYKKLHREQQRTKSKVYVVAENDRLDKSFIKVFRDRNGKSPRGIEARGFEALNLCFQIIGQHNLETREELESALLKAKELRGVRGKWFLNDGIWIKDMKLMEIKHGRLQNITFNENTTNEKKSI